MKYHLAWNWKDSEWGVYDEREVCHYSTPWKQEAEDCCAAFNAGKIFIPETSYAY